MSTGKKVAVISAVKPAAPAPTRVPIKRPISDFCEHRSLLMIFQSMPAAKFDLQTLRQLLDQKIDEHVEAGLIDSSDFLAWEVLTTTERDDMLPIMLTDLLAAGKLSKDKQSYSLKSHLALA